MIETCGKQGMRRILTFDGLGGLICGIDFGIIAVAVPYIRSLRLYSDSQIGWIVGGVLFGGILASACGGFLCDRLGRRAAVRSAGSCRPARRISQAVARGQPTRRARGVDIKSAVLTPLVPGVDIVGGYPWSRRRY